MIDLTKRGFTVVLDTAKATIHNYIQWLGKEPGWYRGVGIGTSKGKPYLKLMIGDCLDEAAARTLVTLALADIDPDGDIPFDVEVVGDAHLPTNEELAERVPEVIRSCGPDGAQSHEVWESICNTYGVEARGLDPKAPISYSTVFGIMSSLVRQGVLYSEPRSGLNRQFFVVGTGTVEGAYAKWASTCPFGDNPLAKAGFEAGWSAVFERMKGPS